MASDSRVNTAIRDNAAIQARGPRLDQLHLILIWCIILILRYAILLRSQVLPRETFGNVRTVNYNRWAVPTDQPLVRPLFPVLWHLVGPLVLGIDCG